MKISTFILTFRNIIILVWWIIVLVFFKIYNNYEFENGTSIIFVSLLIVIPLLIYILLHIYKKKKIKLNNLKKGPFFARIQEEVKNKKFDRYILNQLNSYLPNLIFEDTNNKISIRNSDIEILFEQQLVSINLFDTKIKFGYFYSNKIDSTYLVEAKNIKYRSTIYLYKLLLSKIEELVNVPLIYKENKYGYLLQNENQEVIVSTFVKKKDKKLLICKDINLKK